PEPNPSTAPVLLDKEERVLVVIHGHEASGWRNPEARQVYVLKVPIAAKLVVERRDDFVARPQRGTTRPPLIPGDVMWEAGGSRALYWTGAQYAWYGVPSR